MRDILHDIRIAVRALRQRPLLLITGTLTLGIGLGASTAMFSVIESALLQPLPFRDADRLTVVWGVAGPEQAIRGASPPEIADWDAGVDALGRLVYYDETTVNLSGGQAEQLEAETVAPGFFEVLGLTPALGRTFVPEDDAGGAAGSAIVSHEFWQRRLGGAADVLGRRLRLDDVEFVVVGVMPEGFRGLSFDTEIWVPRGPFVSAESMADRGTRWLAAIGRLAPAATLERAQDQLTAVAARLEEEYPDLNRERGALLLPLRDYYVGQSASLLLMALGGVVLLLLIACANVANLQLVRAVERRREVALRYALGAGRRPVARHLMVESLVLAAFGGMAGLALAWAGLQLLLPLIPPGVLPAYASPGIDGVVLGFGAVATFAAGLLFGLAPAWKAAGEDPADALRGGSRGSTAGLGRAGRPGAQQAIIVVQVALALVLLVGAGLAVRSLRAQLAIAPGFEAEGVLAARVSLTGDRYDREARVTFVESLLERIRGLPGVDHAGVTLGAPLRGRTSATYIYRAEDPINADTRIRFYLHPVTPGAFDALGIRVIEGRGFTAADRIESPAVAVVTESFAAKVWPGREPLGRRLTLGGDTLTVVGLVADVHERDLVTSLMDPAQDPDVYFAYAQLPTSSFDILVRSSGDPAAFTGAIRRAVAELDPAIPLYDVATLDTVLAGQTALSRMVSTLLAVFGVLALVVAGVGLYGILAFVVRGRRREIAIRSALGARPRSILRLVVGQGLTLVAIGLGLGMLAALAGGGLAASFLYGVHPADPVVLTGTALALLAVAATASWIPAHQATRIDPRTAMADE